MKRGIMFLFLLGIAQLIWCQNRSDVVLKISFLHSEAGFNGKQIDIIVTPVRKGYKLSYCMRDTTNTTLMRSDPDFRKMTEEFDKCTDERREVLASGFRALADKYAAYIKDSLVINKANQPGLCQRIDRIRQHDKDFIAQIEKKDDRIILLDRILFKVMIQLDAGITLNYQLTSPTKDDYPVFYSLVKDLLMMYRNKYPDSFLNTDKTFYY